MFSAGLNGETELLLIEMEKAEGRADLGHRISSSSAYVKNEIPLPKWRY